MTRLFNRKDKTTIAELEEYYSNTGKRNRNGMAWLRALLSVVLTIIVIVALFYLGRWIYRAITTNDNGSTTTVSESENGNVELPNFDGDVVGQGNQNSSTETEPELGGVVSDEAAVVTVDRGQSSGSNVSGSSTSNNNSGTTTQNSVGGEGSDIPNTGTGEIIVLIPIATGVAGYFVSRRYLLKQN